MIDSLRITSCLEARQSPGALFGKALQLACAYVTIAIVGASLTAAYCLFGATPFAALAGLTSTVCWLVLSLGILLELAPRAPLKIPRLGTLASIVVVICSIPLTIFLMVTGPGNPKVVAPGATSLGSAANLLTSAEARLDQLDLMLLRLCPPAELLVGPPLQKPDKAIAGEILAETLAIPDSELDIDFQALKYFNLAKAMALTNEIRFESVQLSAQERTELISVAELAVEKLSRLESQVGQRSDLAVSFLILGRRRARATTHQLLALVSAYDYIESGSASSLARLERSLAILKTEWPNSPGTHRVYLSPYIDSALKISRGTNNDTAPVH